MAQEPKSQRTERPTPRRIKKARDKGQVARSREVPGAMVLVGFLVFADFFGAGWLRRMEVLITESFQRIGPTELSSGNLMALTGAIVISTGMLLAAPLGILMVAGVAGNLIQGAPPLTLEPLKPELSKLNPIKGLKKIFALKQWVDVLQSVLKMTLFAAVSYSAVRDVILNGTVGSPGAEGTLLTLFSLSRSVILRCAALAAGLALLDYMFRRYDHTRNLRMTKREIRDELKETEGDPMIRARIRQKQLAVARSRMMAEVPKATVVITNPEHFAVALRYERGETVAPRLLAKGRGLLAQKIRELAAEHGVPIVSDPPLARALFRSVPLGAEIPPTLFRAVAEVLALVFSRKRRSTVAPGEEGRR